MCFLPIRLKLDIPTVQAFHWQYLCNKGWWEFGKPFLKICPTELELKVEHQGNHACFLDLDIFVDNIFVYNCLIKEIHSHLQ